MIEYSCIFLIGDPDMPKKNDIVTIEITDVSSDGLGIGKADGYTLFVQSAFPGDIIKAKIVKVLKNYGFGIINKLVSPAPSRIESDCPSFGRCGGCSFRQISYEAELKIKENHVKNCMARIGGISAPVLSIIPSPKTDKYRNKAQFPASVGLDGNVKFGFYSKHSHRLVESADLCKLHPKIFSDISDVIRVYCNNSKISVYDEVLGTGLLRHLFIRYGETTGDIMVCLVINGTHLPNEQGLVSLLTSSVPGLKSIVINTNTKNTNEILGEKCRTLWGSDAISDVLCGNLLNISPLSFYQVNRSCTELLYNTAFDAASLSSSDVLLDLYCGIGSIGLSAAKRVKEVVGVEIVPQAVEDAKLNAARNGIKNARFICADAKAAVSSLLKENIRPTVAIIDPPRKGCDERLLDDISKMNLERIIMISCNPSTAARDCKYLSSLGYVPTVIQPVDMFPRTTHVETVVLLSRK